MWMINPSWSRPKAVDYSNTPLPGLTGRELTGIEGNAGGLTGRMVRFGFRSCERRGLRDRQSN